VDFFHYRKGINWNGILLCANQLQSKVSTKRSIISEIVSKTFQYCRIRVSVYYLLNVTSVVPFWVRFKFKSVIIKFEYGESPHLAYRLEGISLMQYCNLMSLRLNDVKFKYFKLLS
jgi:hypothetical protein